MKIHIIGCSGSGKTYLAKALSEKYNIPHYDLDDIQWDNNSDGYGVIAKRFTLGAALCFISWLSQILNLLSARCIAIISRKITGTPSFYATAR